MLEIRCLKGFRNIFRDFIQFLGIFVIVCFVLFLRIFSISCRIKAHL